MSKPHLISSRKLSELTGKTFNEVQELVREGLKELILNPGAKLNTDDVEQDYDEQGNPCGLLLPKWVAMLCLTGASATAQTAKARLEGFSRVFDYFDKLESKT
jgi:hypothetical protein